MNELTRSAEFESVVNDGLVMVDFYSKGCAPCRALTMVMDKMTSIFSDAGIKVYKADVENCAEKAAELNIGAVPAVQLFKDGQKIASFVGLRQKSQIVAFIEEHVGVAVPHKG
jgi:thioredoxin 1